MRSVKLTGMIADLAEALQYRPTVVDGVYGPNYSARIRANAIIVEFFQAQIASCSLIRTMATINIDEWRDRDGDGILSVQKAGEILYRLRS